MGSLTGWHYPTDLFLRLADHTYVSCGSGGKAWSCWGGKTGGQPLSTGAGSTRRADAIAEPDERAGITCYLINGVCHQAANRILSPAGILVLGAKGYWVSESMYGTYGRSRGALGMCRAPFNRHASVAGDLPECREAVTPKGASRPVEVEDADFQRYLGIVRDLYAQIDGVRMEAFTDDDSRNFQLKLFSAMARYRLGTDAVDSPEGRSLMDVRASVEAQRMAIEDAFLNDEMTVDEFVTRYNLLFEQFQQHVAEVLSADGYRALLQMERDERVVLGDPEIARLAYPGSRRTPGL